VVEKDEILIKLDLTNIVEQEHFFEPRTP